jgi:two-component system, NtrC family, response regulator PilR
MNAIALLPENSEPPSVPRVLVVDDEADLRELLELTLIGMGLDVDCVADLTQARANLSQKVYSLCLCDMRLPDGDGLSLVAQIRTARPELPVAVITAFGSAENAVAALKAGAFDYLSKPVALDALRNLVRTALKLPSPSRAHGRDETSESARKLKSANDAMLGQSAQMNEVRSTIARLARSMAPVHIHGESGSGKELAARLIHQSSARADQPFIAVNCGAIPESLMESEFFGYRKGAFTGAEQERAGFFHAADGGTLFLDEVADLPLAMQVKLLRAIQERRVRKVGATQEEAVDVRIVSATHQDLGQCVTNGRFRQDLFYRLNVIELQLPSLRERKDDIPQLAQHVLQRIAQRMELTEPPVLASVTLKYLQSYAFPGNVRELENILERAVAFATDSIINVEDLGLRPSSQDAESEPDQDRLERNQQEQQGNATSSVVAPKREVVLSVDGIPDSLPDYLDQIERNSILKALDKTNQNRTAAAKLLGVSFRALRYRMQRLNIG